MKRPARTWTIFAGALAVAFAVMLFFTVKVLDFERQIEVAQSQAALEENVRLALWRMDSAAAVLLARDSGELDQLQSNISSPRPPARHQPMTKGQRFEPQVQQSLNRQEFEQRSALQNEDISDWRSITPVLLDRISDILPGATLEAASTALKDPDDSRRLATIPARLVLPPSALASASIPLFTPLRVALLIAWCSAIFAAIAVGRLLGAAIALSERRGAFASAVTHELRTPLTTFRMYSEMLASGMVPDDLTRKQYLQTLVTESDRLGHLIENVLAYARLENRNTAARAETLTVQDLIARSLPALERRAGQAGFEFVYSPLESDNAPCTTDPVAVQQILLNLVDNACKYGKPPIQLRMHRHERTIELEIIDRGPGLGAAAPFIAFNKARNDPVPGIGLGLYLSRQIARDLGGNLRYRPNEGLCVFVLSLPA